MKRAAALLGLLAACAPYEVADARRDLLQSWGDDLLLPTYAELHQRTLELQDAAGALCAAPFDAGLAEARQAWTAARAPWKRTEVFAFGPYQEEPLRLGPKIDAWPVRPETIESELPGDGELTAESIAGLGVYARGFPALEYLLFQPDVDLVDAFATSPRRCPYLLALAENLTDEVVEFHDAWSPEGGDYLAQLTGAGKTSTEFATLPDALGEVVNRMGFTAQNIHTDKLGRPVGLTSGAGAPQPELAESQFSGRSIDDIRDNLAGIEALFFGGDSALGLTSYLRKRGYRFDAAMDAHLDAARAALDDITGPLVTAVADDPDAVIAAIDQIAGLQILLQTEIIPALSLSVGFNDVDGD